MLSRKYITIHKITFRSDDISRLRNKPALRSILMVGSYVLFLVY